MSNSFNDSIPKLSEALPWITTEQMMEVDRLMVEEYGIQLIQMMENAGRCLAILAKRRFLPSTSTNKSIVVLAGTGGNGGGVMVCARRLSSWGLDVSLAITDQNRLTPIPKQQFDILQKMKVSIVEVSKLNSLEKPALIIDGVIGYSLNGSPRGEAQKMIEWANTSSSKVLALALPKKGLAEKRVKKARGELYLADISVPPSLYSMPTMGLQVKSPFGQGDIIRID